MKRPATSLIECLRELDESRPSLPGEHWVAFGLGLYFLARRRQSSLGRLASMIVGTAFVVRSLTGRDGALAVLRKPGRQDPDASDFVEVAAPWPYEKRVRITPPRLSAD